MEITPFHIQLWVQYTQLPGHGNTALTTLFLLLCTVGITVYAVGVGKAIEEELQEIASKPTDKHLFYAEDFSTMGEISEKLKKGICEGTRACVQEGAQQTGQLNP